MGASVIPDPWQLQLKPDQWQDILRRAMADLRANPQDQEALQAIHDANEALSVYDQAKAASPAERIKSGFEGAVEGLGKAAADIPRGLLQAIAHPIETAKGLPKVPSALKQGLTSDEPEDVARAVGNIGAMLLPAAKTGKQAGAPTAGGVAARAATAPVRGLMELLERPVLRNELLRTRIEAIRNPKPKPAPRHPEGQPRSSLERIREAGRAQGRADAERMGFVERTRRMSDLVDEPAFKRAKALQTGSPLEQAITDPRLAHMTAETAARVQRSRPFVPKTPAEGAVQIGHRLQAATAQGPTPTLTARLATEIKLARQMGMSLDEIARKLASRGITPEQITHALTGR